MPNVLAVAERVHTILVQVTLILANVTIVGNQVTLIFLNVPAVGANVCAFGGGQFYQKRSPQCCLARHTAID